MVDSLRAIALLLENMTLENLVTQATKTIIIDLLLPTTKQLTSTLTDLWLTTDDLRGSAVSITRTADEFRDNTSSSLQYLTDAAAEAMVSAETMVAAMKVQAEAPMPATAPPAVDPTMPITYAAAVGIHLHPAHTTTIARGDARSRQVLVDKAPGANTSGLEELSEKELVEKARMAYEQMAQTNVDNVPPVQFVGARKLRNGGVIYETGTPEAAQWLKSGTNMTSFLQVFSATSIIKHRAYSVIVEYVPLTFDPSDHR